MHKVGNKFDFKRNAVIKGDSVSIAAVVQKGAPTQVQQYVVENEYGWNPDVLRAKIYGLDKKKKYLFVGEHELTAPGTNKKDAEAAKAVKAERLVRSTPVKAERAVRSAPVKAPAKKKKRK